MTPLAGRRIVVTRARHQSRAFITALEARGASVVALPVIAIRPVTDARVGTAIARSLPAYHWAVFASVNAVDAFWGCLDGAGLRAWPPTVRVAAVGPATARALANRGIPVDAVPAIHAGIMVASTMGDLTRARVLLPRGDRGREETARALRDAGASVDPITVYYTDLDTGEHPALQALGDGVDAVTFTSPSTVVNFATLLGDAAHAFLTDTVLATIGPATSAALRAAGWGESLEAAIATTDGIVTALEAHFTLAGHAPRAGR